MDGMQMTKQGSSPVDMGTEVPMPFALTGTGTREWLLVELVRVREERRTAHRGTKTWPMVETTLKLASHLLMKGDSEQPVVVKLMLDPDNGVFLGEVLKGSTSVQNLWQTSTVKL